MRTSIPFQTIFGNHVRQLREQAELALKQLSEKSGFSIHRLRAIERGKVNMNLGTMLILAMCLDTTLQDLLTGVARKLDHRKFFATRVIPFSHCRKDQQNNCQNSAAPALREGHIRIRSEARPRCLAVQKEMGARIAELRRERHVSQEALADSSGLGVVARPLPPKAKY